MEMYVSKRLLKPLQKLIGGGREGGQKNEISD